jgi:hypothetical protein
MKTVLQILEEAQKLVMAGWTQGAWARDNQGLPVKYLVNGNKAVCFCTLGAIYHNIESGDDGAQIGEETQSRFKEAISSKQNIVRWNDAPERTREEVVAAFDRAIQLEKHLNKIEAP